MAPTLYVLLITFVSVFGGQNIVVGHAIDGFKTFDDCQAVGASIATDTLPGQYYAGFEVVQNECVPYVEGELQAQESPQG